MKFIQRTEEDSKKLGTMSPKSSTGILKKRLKFQDILILHSFIKAKADVTKPQVAVGCGDGVNSTLRAKMDIPFFEKLGTVIGGKNTLATDHIADFMAPLTVFRHGITIDAPHFTNLTNQNISKFLGSSGGIILKEPVKPIVLS